MSDTARSGRAAPGPASAAVRRVAPGLLLSLGVALAAGAGARLETRLFGRPLVEALVLAILIGMAVRAAWPMGAAWRPGIRTAGKPLLELAVVGLGASVNLPALLRAGPALLGGIVATVGVAIVLSYGVSRAVGLNHRHALLVACGNSICGNSAIAAVAPVIRAEDGDVASSLAFTNLLGITLVLVLPLAARAAGWSFYQYGVVAGLSVYSVPQVVAATFSVSALAGQVGTLVKFSRVLLLGPVVLLLAIGHRGRGQSARLRLHQFVPWFIVGFLALAVARSAGAVPPPVQGPVQRATTALMVLAMAGLGLGVEIRGIAHMGARVTVAAATSLGVLLVASTVLIRLLHIA